MVQYGLRKIRSNELFRSGTNRENRLYLKSKKEEAGDLPISKYDVAFLESLGDTEIGNVARGEVAEMYDVEAEEIDTLILNRIHGDEPR